MDDLLRSPYRYLFDDEDFKRWFYNMKRGHVSTAYEWFRRMGFIHKTFGKSPRDMAKMKPKQATNFILDIVTQLEEEGKSGSYISNIVKPIKSWLDFNSIQIQQKIRISNRQQVTTVNDERIPMAEELKRIFSMANFRTRTGASFMSLGGARVEVLADFRGLDGLEIRDLPEMEVLTGNNEVRFKKVPTITVVRSTISKVGHQYFTFYPHEGCLHLKQLLEWRMLRKEKLVPESAIITPMWKTAGKHINSNNMGDEIRYAIRAAGFSWRPYVLRRYFDTRMMMAEVDGLIIRDWRVFWMGHSGDIEHTYTLNKRLPEDLVEKMRKAFEEASERYLVTEKSHVMTRDMTVATFNAQFLEMGGYSKDEVMEVVKTFGDLSKMQPHQIQDLVKRKSMERLGLNGNTQKIILMGEVERYIMDGWEFVKELNSNKVIVRLPR